MTSGATTHGASSPDSELNSAASSDAGHTMRRLAQSLLEREDRVHFRAVIATYRRSGDMKGLVTQLARFVNSSERLPLLLAISQQMRPDERRQQFLELARSKIPIFAVSEHLSRARQTDGSNSRSRRASFLSTASSGERPTRNREAPDQNRAASSQSALGERVAAELQNRRSRPALEVLSDKGFWNPTPVSNARKRRSRVEVLGPLEERQCEVPAWEKSKELPLTRVACCWSTEHTVESLGRAVEEMAISKAPLPVITVQLSTPLPDVDEELWSDDEVWLSDGEEVEDEEYMVGQGVMEEEEADRESKITQTEVSFVSMRDAASQTPQRRRK